jgi:hypothetical protein
MGSSEACQWGLLQRTFFLDEMAVAVSFFLRSWSHFSLDRVVDGCAYAYAAEGLCIIKLAIPLLSRDTNIMLPIHLLSMEISFLLKPLTSFSLAFKI